MRAISFRPLAALAAALSMSVAGMSPAANLSEIRLLPVNIPKPGSRKKTKRMRSGERYPFSSNRQQRRDAVHAAKMRADLEAPREAKAFVDWLAPPYLNVDLIRPHLPANSGPGMDIAGVSRQQRRAADRREAKAMASNFRKMRRKEGSGVVSIDWRIFAKNLKLRRDAEAAQAAG